MLQTIKKIQAWGNSFGIRLSKDELQREQLKPDEQVLFFIRKNTNPAKELFGTLKLKESTADIMRDIDTKFKSRFE